jgi:hypothetical protein
LRSDVVRMAKLLIMSLPLFSGQVLSHYLELISSRLSS